MKRRPPEAAKPRRYSYRQSFVRFDRPYPLKLQGKEVPGFWMHGEPVTICIPLPDVPPLTEQEKQEITKESGINFLTPDDWHTIHDALCRYVLAVRQTREGDYDEICERLNTMKARALAFMESVTHKDEADTLAINRLFKIAGEEIYGRISAVVAETANQIDKTLGSIEQERLLPKPDPLRGFVAVFREIFAARGVPFTCPKAKDYANPKLSRSNIYAFGPF